MRAVAIDPERFAARVLQDCFTQALSSHWKARASTFEAARPRPGDYPGLASAADLAAADRRCAAIAKACRARATVDVFDPEPVDRALVGVV